MTTEHDALSLFQEAYLDYLEGERDAAPTLDDLSGDQRRLAEAFIETIKAVRGIDPYASRPPLEKLLASNSDAASANRDLESGLQDHLRQTVDPDALVTVDAASGATGLDSSLVIQARGIRMRVVEEKSDDLDGALDRRAVDIAMVFSTFSDCQAVLYTTSGRNPSGVVLVRGDVHGAIETPSGKESPPRLPRSAVAAAKACEVWLKGLIPEFDPLSKEVLEGAMAAQSSIDAFGLASKVVDELAASGARARIEAKQEAWGTFGSREAQQLAALVEDAREGRLSAENYGLRMSELSEIAA